VKTAEPLGWRYIVATIFAIGAALFLAWLEDLFVRSWAADSTFMYFPAFVTAVAALVIVISTFLYSRRVLMLWFIVAASVAAVSMTCWFLLEIIPIAQGNNDSGDIFWFVVLPSIALSIYAFVSYSKLKALQPEVSR
jgi:hypothetical protein